ncbi:Hsp20/alpha crystallin family protein [Candidatus Roizmanbacteria bacterium]|nr:Hsp20/alpha crystallin family protein [Candidatus Roizmanbacteria bacterium]
MAIIRFDPFIQLQRQFFQPLMEDNEWPELTMTEGLNVYEENSNVIVEASVPGIPEDKLEITYEDGVLHIKGRSEEKEEEKKKNRVIHRMQRVSSFDYSTYLPRPIDEKQIEATVKNGVLTVKAPIAEAAKPKRIPVKLSSK